MISVRVRVWIQLQPFLILGISKDIITKFEAACDPPPEVENPAPCGSGVTENA